MAMGELAHLRGGMRETGGHWGSFGGRGEVRTTSGSLSEAIQTWGTSEGRGEGGMATVKVGRTSGPPRPV